MSLRLLSRAALCQLLSAPVIAVTLAGCGGVAVSSSPGSSGTPDASPSSDASPSGDAAAGCPSIADIDSGAALGKTCSPEGAYCADDQTCDPCTQNCPAVSCTNGVWTQAVGTAGCAYKDAGPPACASIDGSSFDQSCQSDSDCVAVTAGTFCAGKPQCPCGLDAVNVKDQSQYEKQLATVEAQNPPGPNGCFCPFFGKAHCVHNHCIVCGGAGPACPDGG